METETVINENIKKIYKMRVSGHSLLSIADSLGLTIEQVETQLDEALSLVNMGASHTLDHLRWEDLGKLEEIYLEAMKASSVADDPSKYFNTALRALDTRAKMLHYYQTPPATLTGSKNVNHEFIKLDLKDKSTEELEALYGSFLKDLSGEQ